MANKNILSRIQHKHDTQANWEKAVNFIPLEGEIIVYDVDGTYSYSRIKIGDGATSVVDLPFTDVPSDWSQTNETAPDFIKNKPSLATSEEIKALFN